MKEKIPSMMTRKINKQVKERKEKNPTYIYIVGKKRIPDT
jgi:hypothetical protein